MIDPDSRVYIHNPRNAFQINNTWRQLTSYAPGPGSYTAVWNDTKSFLNIANVTPADRLQPLTQVVFEIYRWRETATGTPLALNWFSYDQPTGGFPANFRSYGSAARNFDFSANAIETEVECLNLRARWCGDGVTDTDRGETCDLGAANGTPGSSCSSTCGRVLFDLGLKKLVNGEDAQTAATAVPITTGVPFSYTFIVTNNGAANATGITSVSDANLPAGVQLTAPPSGTGWNCSLVSGGFVCTRADTLAVGASFPVITAQAIVSSATSGIITNTATLNNPDENPANNFNNNNTDPANIRVIPAVTPCMSGTTVGIQPNPVNIATPGLCAAGAVGNFTTLTGSTITGQFTYGYTWSCG